MKYIPQFLPVKLMSDAAPAIYNGISVSYPNIVNGRCYFHMMKSMKERPYSDIKIKNEFLNDLRALSKSHDVNHFDESVKLFLVKYRGHDCKCVTSATSHLEKVWLSDRNRGWHSGLAPGTVTSNNGLDVTNRVFKSNLKGTITYCLW